MGVTQSVFKKCECGGTAEMEIRTGYSSPIDLDNHYELAVNYSPKQMLDLYDTIIDDGDPFICNSCKNKFHLDTELRIKVASLLFPTK